MTETNQNQAGERRSTEYITPAIAQADAQSLASLRMQPKPDYAELLDALKFARRIIGSETENEEAVELIDIVIFRAEHSKATP